MARHLLLLLDSGRRRGEVDGMLAVFSVALLSLMASSPLSNAQTPPNETSLSRIAPGTQIQFPLEWDFTPEDSRNSLWVQFGRVVGTGIQRPDTIENGPRCQVSLKGAPARFDRGLTWTVVQSVRTPPGVHGGGDAYWLLLLRAPDGHYAVLDCLGDHDFLGFYSPPTIADFRRTFGQSVRFPRFQTAGHCSSCR